MLIKYIKLIKYISLIKKQLTFWAIQINKNDFKRILKYTLNCSNNAMNYRNINY